MSNLDETRQLGPRAWPTLIVLTTIYTLHYVDRSIIGVLIEPLKHEFLLSDAQLGVLSGLIYGLLYATAGLGLGYLIDRVNRRNLLGILLFFWSACTALSGFAVGFWSLFAARAAVGVSESGAAPTAMSLLSDVFPRQRRATAIGIFWASTTFGLAVASVVGGFVAVHYGWRAAFFIAGLPGLLMIPVLFAIVREPTRGALDAVTKAGSPAPTVPEIWSAVRRNPVFLWSQLGMVFNSAASGTILTWSTSFFVRSYGLNLFQAGIILASAAFVFGSFGTYLGGSIGDRLGRRGLSGLALTPAGSALLACAAMTLTLTSMSLWGSIVGYALWELTYRAYFGPGNTTVISTLEPRMRGIAGSISQATVHILGFGWGPTLAGFVSDRVGGPNAIRWGIGSGLVFFFGTAASFLMASRAARKLEASGAAPWADPSVKSA